MKAAHSPSPWKVTKNGDVLANDTVLYTVSLNFSADKEQIKANAYLIAAAPELFSALCRIRSELRSLHLNPNGDMLEMIEYIITQATGGY